MKRLIDELNDTVSKFFHEDVISQIKEAILEDVKGKGRF